MKAIKNYSKSEKNGFLIDLIPVMLLFAFVIYVFVFQDKSNFMHNNLANINLSGNYSGSVNNSLPEKMNTIKINNVHKDQILLSHSVSSFPAKTIGSKPVLDIATNNEKSLEIEDWMRESKYFSSTNNWYADEPDQPLKIEQWMISSSFFCSFPGKITNDKEKELRIESWMTDKLYWH